MMVSVVGLQFKQQISRTECIEHHGQVRVRHQSLLYASGDIALAINSKRHNVVSNAKCANH